MASLMDKISTAPKWLILTVAVLFVGGLGYIAYATMLKPKNVEVVPEHIDLDIIDAEIEGDNRTTIETFRETEREAKKDYWDQLLGESAQEPSDDPFDTDMKGASKVEEKLDPAVYSRHEIYMIKHGYKTKEEIDREHMERIRQNAEEEARKKEQYEPQQEVLTRAQQESLYFARVERTMQLVNKNMAQAQPVDEPVEEEEPERTVDLSASTSPASLPSDFNGGGGIISSLDSPESLGRNEDGSIKAVPVKATFLKNEKLTSGQRVIIRLMQDLRLSDGTVIPANTHITGTCQTGRRLKINVSMLHYAGNMFPVDLSVYDNDGTEGIYCPMAEETKKKGRAVRNAASGAVSAAGTILSAAMGVSPILGSMASSGISTATSSIASDGSVSVSVSAGYEFYVFENTKQK